MSRASRTAPAGTPEFAEETPLAPAVVVGLMSGTSLDGISAAVARFVPGVDHISAELLAFRSLPYTREQRERLLRALEGTTPVEYCRLNFELGSWLADAAIAVLADAGVARDDVRAIASHGQTVWHEPGHSTWQFGEAAVIAERTGIGVVSDFRVRDVAAGGQGAPLVPIADALLFHDAHRWRALQNLGGIGNVTIVPPGGALDGVRAFDTGPGVGVIDGVTRMLFPELPYDVDGALARQGQPVDERRSTSCWPSPTLRRHRQRAPAASCSRARTWSGSSRCVAQQRERGEREDIIATAVELTAASIADAFRRFIPEPVAEIVVSGGGARNPALVDAIARRMAPAQVARFDDLFFDGEAKEAVAFALMGYLFAEQRAGNVPGATGARGPSPAREVESGMSDVAQLLLPALRWDTSAGWETERPLIEKGLQLGVGGFILFGGVEDAVRSLTKELRQRSRVPLLIGADLERGAGQQIAGATGLPPLAAIASLGDTDAVRRAARLTAREARTMGVNWDFAPVCDLDIEPANPIIGTPLVREQSSPRGKARERVGRCVPGRGRVGVREALPRTRPHDRGLAHDDADGQRIEAGSARQRPPAVPGRDRGGRGLDHDRSRRVPGARSQRHAGDPVA